MDYFQHHKQTLVFQHSKQSFAVNDTPLDHQLRAKIATFDIDFMEIRFREIENDYSQKAPWNDFLSVVYKVRNKRKARFNEVCKKLETYPAICYQIKNWDVFYYNKVEGLWVIIRGDIWRLLNPSIFIDNTHVDEGDAVLLQFEEVFTDCFSPCDQSCDKLRFKNTAILHELYDFLKKRYLTIHDIEKWLYYIQKGEFVRNLKTIAVLTFNNENNWFPKKNIYYFDFYNPGQLDGVIEFKDGILHSIPLKAKCNYAIERTIVLTNKDCEIYCSLADPKDSQPYAFNGIYYNKHRTWGYYIDLIYSLEFIEHDYNQYLENEIESICIK
jgi:hypothetical protein